MAFDPLTMVQIDLIAMRQAIEIDPDVAPISLMDDDLIGRAIAEHFSDCEEWSDNLLEIALAEYRDAESAAVAVEHLVAGFLTGRLSGWMR